MIQATNFFLCLLFTYYLIFMFSVLGWAEPRKMIRLCLRDKIEGWEYEVLDIQLVWIVESSCMVSGLLIHDMISFINVKRPAVLKNSQLLLIWIMARIKF